MILVYSPDPSEAASVTALQEWIESALRYSRTDSIIFSLWANETNDELSGTEDDSEELKGLKERYKIPSSLHFRVSALSGKGIMEAFHSVIEAVTTNALDQEQNLNADYSLLNTGSVLVEAQDKNDKKVCPKC